MNRETLASNFAQITAHQEMHVAPAVRQLRAIITADRARTDNRDAKIHYFTLVVWFRTENFS